jgi:hypothetical protein
MKCNGPLHISAPISLPSYTKNNWVCISLDPALSLPYGTNLMGDLRHVERYRSQQDGHARALAPANPKNMMFSKGGGTNMKVLPVVATWDTSHE